MKELPGWLDLLIVLAYPLGGITAILLDAGRERKRRRRHE